MKYLIQLTKPDGAIVLIDPEHIAQLERDPFEGGNTTAVTLIGSARSYVQTVLEPLKEVLRRINAVYGVTIAGKGDPSHELPQ